MARTGVPETDRRLDGVLLEMVLAKLQYLTTELARLRTTVAELKGLPLSGADEHVPDTLTIDAEAIGPFERGFYPCEYDSKGRAFRWTGDGDLVELRFLLNRNHGHRFIITGYLPDDRADIGSVRAFVDYLAVPIEVEPGANVITLSGPIPPSPLETSATLTLWSQAPLVRENQPAGRTLWFIFWRIDVVSDAVKIEAGDAEVETATRSTSRTRGDRGASGGDRTVAQTAVPAHE